MNSSLDNNKFGRRLIYVCDAIILNACITAVAYVMHIGIDLLWAIILINAISLIALRQWLIHILEINWLTSPLNRCLKRLADIFVSCVYLLTLFPIILIICTIIIKKNNTGPILTKRQIRKNSEIINVLTFNIAQGQKKLPTLLPIAINIIIGAVSLWDLNSLEIIQTEPDTVKQGEQEQSTTEECASENTDISDNAFKEEEEEEPTASEYDNREIFIENNDKINNLNDLTK